MVPLSVSTSSIQRLFSLVEMLAVFGFVGPHAGDTSPDDFHSMDPDVSTRSSTFGCCETTSGPSVCARAPEAESKTAHAMAPSVNLRDVDLGERRFLILPTFGAGRTGRRSRSHAAIVSRKTA